MFLLLLGACGTPLAPVTVDTVDTGDTADTEGEDGFPFGDTILSFGLALDVEALAALAADPRTDVYGIFTFNDESYDVGVHLKGSASFQDMSGKPSFKIDFHQWTPDQRFHDLERLTLNAMVQDASMSSEHAAYKLYAALGLTAPRHGYAQVSVNGELYGLYGVVEPLDEHFINLHFDDDSGNLYEGGYGADILDGRADNFEIAEQGLPENRVDLQALIDAVDASTPSTYFSVLSANFNTDALLDQWAAELVSSNSDAYTTLANNYFLYHEPTTARWTMILWGPDQAFIDDLDVHASFYGRMAQRCAEAPDCAARLDERMAHVLDVWQSEDLVGFVAAETARIEDACRTDPRSPWGDYGCRDAQAAMRDWTAARPGIVRSTLP